MKHGIMQRHLSTARVLLVLCWLLGKGIRIEAFSIPPTTRRTQSRARSIKTKQQWPHYSTNDTPSSEWDARNIYDDLDRLRQSISQEQAQDKLRETQRLELLNNFAANRRPLFPDVKRYVLLPVASAIFISAFSVQSQEFSNLRRLVGLVFRFEFWFVVVAAPIRLLLSIYLTKPPPKEEEEDSFASVRGSELYDSVVRLTEKEEMSNRDAALHLLEQWVTAVGGTALLGACFVATNTGRSLSRLWPCLRFITRLGAVASLHQYPKLLYDLRRQPRPVNKLASRLQGMSKLMLRLAIFGLTMDLSEMMLRTLPRIVLLTMCLALMSVCNLQIMLSNLAATTMQGTVQVLAAKAIGWVPYILSGRLLWSLPASRIKALLTKGLLPIGLSATAPLLHVVALLRLVRIQYTHDVSLANASARHILEDQEALQKRMRWRYRINWRGEPILRIRAAISDFMTEAFNSVFFYGGVQDKILEMTKQHYRQDAKMLIEKVQEVDKFDDSKDSTKWKDSSIENLAREHQTDYESGKYRDPLGVAIQQTFGIGLGYQDTHMDALPEGEVPTPRRLQSRAAKSAIRRVQEIYDKTLDVDWDSLTDVDEREALKAELRQREEAETEYLASQLKDLIPQADDGEYDDPAARINLPKTSIRKMIRSLTNGITVYDEPSVPTSGIPWEKEDPNEFA